MRKLWDHRCSACNHVEEVFVEDEENETECVKCGGTAKRLIPAPRWLENAAGVDGTFPGAAIKWERDTRKRHRLAGQAHDGTQCQRDAQLK